jgi:hypothetical protein
VNRERLAQAEMATRADRIVLDMDSSERPVHGAQAGTAFNGHVESVCDHPLLLFTAHGDCLAVRLRPGDVQSAEDWDDLLVPELDRQPAEGTRVAFRADAAFAKAQIDDTFEQRDVDCAIRLPAIKSLELEIEDIHFRLPGRPSGTPVVASAWKLWAMCREEKKLSAMRVAWSSASGSSGRYSSHSPTVPRVGGSAPSWSTRWAAPIVSVG